MHELVGVEVRHAVRDLSRHLDHLAQAWRDEHHIILLEVKKKKKSHLQNHALFQGLHIHLCSVTLSPAGHAAKEPGLAQKERVIIETVASGSGSSHAPAG